MTTNDFEHKYLVGFQFQLVDDPETYQGTTTISTEIPLNEEDPDHFQEIAKTLFRAINDEHPNNTCDKVAITSVAEDSEEIRAIKNILDNSNLRPNDDIFI